MEVSLRNSREEEVLQTVVTQAGGQSVDILTLQKYLEEMRCVFSLQSSQNDKNVLIVYFSGTPLQKCSQAIMISQQPMCPGTWSR